MEGAPALSDTFAPASADSLAPASADTFAPASADSLVPASADILVPASADSLVHSSADAAYLQSQMKQERGYSMEGITDAIGAVIDQFCLNKDFMRHPSLVSHRTGNLPDYAVAASPLAATWIMKAAGVKSRSSTRRLLLSNALALGFAGGFTELLKHTTSQPRPDFSDNHTFPSGHTALAFVGASVLHREYGYLSPWISLSGYAVASLTEALRVRHYAHWTSDLSMGSAVGLMSANLAYFITDRILSEKDVNTVGWNERNRQLRLHINDRPSGLTLTDFTESGVRDIASEQLTTFSPGLDYHLRCSDAVSTGLDLSYFLTDNFAVEGLFRYTQSLVKVCADDSSLGFTGGHLNGYHYDLAFRGQAPLWLPSFLGFLYRILPPTLMSARVLCGGRTLSGIQLSQVAADGSVTPFCQLPSQTSLEVGGGIGFDFIAGPHFTTGIFVDYYHAFSHVLTDRYAIGSTWKVVF